ncbi:MAG: methyltransferase, TIGR04325 family [Spongiibacteraceae bacterium]|nr:methyltransferase, TIGR04325 family [Spongiibacteraceae bacterium]
MLDRMLDRARSLPVIRQYRKRKYDRRFLNNRFVNNRSDNLFRGVYPNFAAARQALPDVAPAGYDNPASAGMYRQWLDTLRVEDYPVLFWLSQIKTRINSLVDFGGHIGFLYYSARRFINASDSFIWQAMDVPAVIAAGRALAKERGADELTFIDSRETVPACDVFIASGSLQYIEPTLADLLRNAATLPRHVLVNMTPLHDQRGFFTVNSIGTAYCVYGIQQKPLFFATLESLAYQRVAAWTNPGKQCHIPFHPEAGPVVYHGGYWTRSD